MMRNESKNRIERTSNGVFGTQYRERKKEKQNKKVNMKMMESVQKQMKD